jgi:hypothetical protein
MDLVAGYGSSDCWVEVRPLIASKMETANFTSVFFTPVLDTLHNLGKPFRFFVVAPRDNGGDGCGGDGCGGERALVRFFFQFSDEQTRVQMSNVIRTLLDVEVVGGANPPKHQYRFCVDLELAKNYALPVVLSGQRQELVVNLVDRLTASMAGLGVCVEVVAKADPNAALGIQKFVYDKLSHKSSLSGVSALVLDPLADLVGAGIGKDPQGESSTVAKSGRSGQNKGVDPWSRELVKNAELKLASNLFTCQILVFGNSLQSVQAVKKALPVAPTNRFKTSKTTKKPGQCPITVLREPSRYVVRNSVLCRLWWAVPLSVLLFVWFFGLFNPLKFVSASSVSLLSVVDLGVLGFVVSLAFCLFMVFRRRNAVVLSTQELSQIVGLPTAITKLPIALGKVPVSRMQLGSEHVEEEVRGQEAKEVSFDKEEVSEERSQECTSLSSRHYLTSDGEDSLSDFKF